jgi:hypothetical protein
MESKDIYLVKTHGCSACKLMEYILKEVLQDRTDINYSILYRDEAIVQFNKVEFKDFPSVVFVKNGEVLMTFTGTCSAKRVKTLMNELGF